MAQQQNDQSRFKPTFKRIELLRNETLGIGSYGAVCKAKCDDLLCAAKIIHRTLIDPNAELQIERHREHRLPIRRFEKEIDFMSAIRHPNIAQYLGTHQDPETGLAVLLMELMDDSLTHFLESSQEPIPFHIQINICHDIAMALSFLHSNDIIHRDMSSNNVLLMGNSRAKVTDFGMAKLGDLNPQATRVSFTMCPGTEVYMPPEATNEDRLRYTEKIDCFSFGVLVIQILTRVFPKPGNKMKTVFVNDPQFPDGIETRALESERRQNHISQVDPNHSLLPIALDCLKDKDVERPSAQDLCHRVAALKQTSQYTDSKTEQRYGERGRVTQERDSTTDIPGLEQQIDEKQQQIRSLEYQIENFQQQHSSTLQEKLQYAGSVGSVSQEKNTAEVKQLKKLLESKIQENKQLKEQNAFYVDEIEYLTQQGQDKDARLQICKQMFTTLQEVTQNPTQVQQQESHSGAKSMKLIWKDGGKAPFEMISNCDAVVIGCEAYFKDHRKIYAYNLTNATWSQPLFSPILCCSLAMVKNNLTAIGGEDRGKVTNQLFSLTGEGASKTWVELPPMPTKRSHTIAIRRGGYLVVAGGRTGTKYLTTVEVLNTDTMKWSTAADLPSPLSSSSATICGDCIFMLGGWNSLNSPTNSVLTCSLSDLLKSCHSGSLGARLKKSLSLTSGTTVWSRIADLAVTGSACVVLHGRLLAIGGEDSDKDPSSTIRMYNSINNSWEVISHMTTPRSQCSVVILPGNKLMVVGGRTLSASAISTGSVEIASVDELKY